MIVSIHLVSFDTASQRNEMCIVCIEIRTPSYFP